MAKQLKKRPSEVYGIEDEVTAWSFDRAVLAFGNALESRLHDISRKSKNSQEADRRVARELHRWLSSADTKAVAAKGQFADPMEWIKKQQQQ